MKIEIKETQLTEVIIDSYTQCDRCKAKIPELPFEVFECTLTRNQYFSFPEGRSGTIEQLDLCYDCSEELFSLMQQNGFIPQVTDI